jgi:hypothetical protein
MRLNSHCCQSNYAASPKRKSGCLGYATQHLPVTIRIEHLLLFAVVYPAVQRLCHDGKRFETEGITLIPGKSGVPRVNRFGKLFKICEVSPAIFALLLCFQSRAFLIIGELSLVRGWHQCCLRKRGI